MSQKGWDVVQRGRVVNRVFFDSDMTAEDVKRSLIEHDDFPSDIHVVSESDLPRGASGRGRRYSPNEDLKWREVYSHEYHAAAARGVEPLQAREEASRAAWADYEARTGASGHVANDSLRRRIAQALGWSESGTRSMSLASLRDLVRPVDPALAEEIGERIRAGGHIRQPGGAQRSQAELWRQMFGREPPSQRPNGSGYYVWALARGSNEPLAEGPWGPYETLESAKTFARIGATEGAHDRAVSLGFDPESTAFRIVRRYEARTGERLL